MGCKERKSEGGAMASSRVGANGNAIMGVKEMMVLTLLGFCYLVLFHAVKGEGRKAMEEDRPAHKHSIKTIKNAFGDIIDCVDINKQPAFDHPLLKNHTIQMRPTFLPEGIIDNVTSRSMSSQVAIMNEKCPTGSIPIMRIPKKLITAKSMSNLKVEDTTNVHLHNSTTTDAASYFAQIRMQRGEYYGSIAELNVYGIPQISADQSSCSAIWVINEGDGLGHKEQINSIVAGWMVNPSIFGDTQTRLFIYWTADGYQSKSCLNLLCPGFVQVNPKLPLGGIITPVSVYEGTQYFIRILVFEDPKTGNWWLVVGEDSDRLLGYWPKSIFSTLVGHANRIYWGGAVYTSNGKKSPPMGSGQRAQEGYGKACIFDEVRLVAEGNVYREIEEKEILYYQNKPQCYDVGYFHKRKVGRYFSFGGPGGC